MNDGRPLPLTHDTGIDEVTDKNLALAFEFTRGHLADHEVPDGATLVLLPGDDN